MRFGQRRGRRRVQGVVEQRGLGPALGIPRLSSDFRSRLDVLARRVAGGCSLPSSSCPLPPDASMAGPAVRRSPAGCRPAARLPHIRFPAPLPASADGGMAVQRNRRPAGMRRSSRPSGFLGMSAQQVAAPGLKAPWSAPHESRPARCRIRSCSTAGQVKAGKRGGVAVGHQRLPSPGVGEVAANLGITKLSAPANSTTAALTWVSASARSRTSTRVVPIVRGKAELAADRRLYARPIENFALNFRCG